MPEPYEMSWWDRTKQGLADYFNTANSTDNRWLRGLGISYGAGSNSSIGANEYLANQSRLDTLTQQRNLVPRFYFMKDGNKVYGDINDTSFMDKWKEHGAVDYMSTDAPSSGNGFADILGGINGFANTASKVGGLVLGGLALRQAEKQNKFQEALTRGNFYNSGTAWNAKSDALTNLGSQLSGAAKGSKTYQTAMANAPHVKTSF